MRKKACWALLVLMLLISMIPAMKKDAKAGQYDYYLTFDTQGGHLDSWSGPATKQFTLSQSYYSAGAEAAKHTAYKEGYNFLGWYTAASGGTKVTKSYYGAPSRVYAHWQKKTYTVSYNANGGSGAPAAQTKTYGVNLTLRTGKPTRTGYIFQGWATSANGGVVYSAGGTYKNNSGVTLYAVWKKQTFTITIYSNPGGQNGSVYTMTKEYGVNVTIPPTSAPTGQYLAGYGIPGATTTIKYHAGDTYSQNANLTLYPIFYKYTYPVSYNANGGNNPPANQTKTYGENLTLASGSPTRTGYTFLGWGTSANATTVSYSPNGVYTGNAELKLFAIWRINTYSVTYNANGGTGAPGAQTKTYNVNLPLSTTRPTRTGYTFQGWGTSAGATTVAYNPGSTYTGNAALALYAIWKIDQYDVVYNANGGTGAPASVKKTYGQDLKLSGTIPTRDGYDFKGWATSANGAVAYAAGGTYKNNSAVTLYAVWAKKTYSITVYASTGANGSAYTYTKEHGVNFTIPSTSAPTGHYLAGYGVPGATSTVKYHVGDVYKDNAHLTLYPIFKKLTYAVNYNANGGSNAPTSQIKTYGENLVLQTTVPVRTGYDFLGWATSANGPVAYSAGGTYAKNEAVTLYAVWKKKTFTVTIYSNPSGPNGSAYTMTKEFGESVTIPSTTAPTGQYLAGYGIPGATTTVKYHVGDTYSDNANITLYPIFITYTYPVTLDVNGGDEALAALVKTYGEDLDLGTVIPKREGYDFQGWSDTPNGSVKWAPGAHYTVNQAGTLYAVWKVKTYRIGFNGYGAPSGVLKTHGISLTMPGPIAQKEGYTFDGWSNSYMSSSVAYRAGDLYTGNCSIEFFAIWSPNGYAVKYNLNGAVGSVPEQVKFHDEDLTLTTFVPQRDGYEFLGWSLSYNDATVAYQPGDVYTDNAAMTLYAVWSFVHATKYDYVNTREGYLINDKYVQFMSAPAFLPSAVTGKLADLGESVLWKVNKLSCGYYTFTRGGKYLCENGSKIELATYDDTNIPTKAVWIVEEVASDDAPYVKNYKLKNYSTGYYLCQNNEAKYEPRFLSGQTGSSGFVYDAFYTDGTATWCFVEPQNYTSTNSATLRELKATDLLTTETTLDVFATLDTTVLFPESCFRTGAADFTYEILSGTPNGVVVEYGKLVGYTGGRVLVRLTHKLTGVQVRVTIDVPNTGILVVPGMMGTSIFGNEYGTESTYEIILNRLRNEFGDQCDVILAGYNWAKSNASSANTLAGYINNYDRVILVCHSMGGLVASRYIADNYSQNKVQKAFYIGTPFLGAPKNAYLMTGGNPAALAKKMEIASQLVQFAVEQCFPEEYTLFQVAVLFNEFMDQLHGEAAPDYYVDITCDEMLGESKVGEWLVGSAIQGIECLFMDSAYELLPSLARDELMMAGLQNTQEAIGVTCDQIEDNFGEISSLTTVNAPIRLQRARAFKRSLWDSQYNHYSSYVDSYYMVCKDKMTINSIDGGGKYNGDGTVPGWSSTINNKYPDRVRSYSNISHTGLVQSTIVITDIIEIIRNWQ
ncbi:MAG: InlB B-repeat-containing protein [Lachnospiraceae bacterium]|nr:InlB B-repeat-containing protein [Lachnospiraceae bacterium]